MVTLQKALEVTVPLLYEAHKSGRYYSYNIGIIRDRLADLVTIELLERPAHIQIVSLEYPKCNSVACLCGNWFYAGTAGSLITHCHKCRGRYQYLIEERGMLPQTFHNQLVVLVDRIAMRVRPELNRVQLLRWVEVVLINYIIKQDIQP